MGKSGKRKSIVVEPGVEKNTVAEVVDYLKDHVLLQHCTLEKLGGEGIGKLVWARNRGSVFWPALIVDFDDEPGAKAEEVEVPISPDEYRSVIFLEKSFRYAVLGWCDIILAEEDMIDLQEALLFKYNKFIIKKTWRGEKSYRDAVSLLKTFISIQITDRQDHISRLGFERKRIKNSAIDKVVKRPGSGQKSIQTPGPSALSMKLPSTLRDRDNVNYSLRKSIPKKIPTPESSVLNDASRPGTPDTASLSSNSGGEETLSDISRKAKKRPKVGGAAMKQFAEDKFLSVDKGFRLDAKYKSESWTCATCFKDIDPGMQEFCHDMPHHKQCLKEVQKLQKDGTSLNVLKCTMCIEKQCFQCKATDKNGEAASKCSKCDLLFHRSCLASWPQAEIQGSTGPITCPVHFCHSCMAEQKVYGKMRSFKAYSSHKYRCIQCLSTYHKPTCIPAGCIETITGRDFIVCPKHTLPAIKITQRRFGCLTCGINLKAKNDYRVDCTMCLQIFHPECVGYTDKENESGIPLSVFAKDYRCVSCVWGLVPLYGQVVWYQQNGHPFWPARILYPREAMGRNDSTVREDGEYSIKYFAPQPSYFDRASRTFPLHLTTVKTFTVLKIYQETTKVKSSYEEASFFHQLVEDLRDSGLPKPEPFYKRIERNIYRTGPVVTRRKKEATGSCFCSERKDEEVCTQNSECHNRDTAVECNEQNCDAGSRCRNRMFSQKSKEVDATEQFLCPSKGWAVKAAKDFKDGDFVIEYCGEIINNAEMQFRANRKSEEDPLYLLEIDKNTFIDAEFHGNVSRLINHSCEPNCRTEKYTSDGRSVVGVFAQTNISKGEELTFDYAYGSESAAPFRCYCRTPSCRAYIGKNVTEELVLETPNTELELYDKQCAKCSFGGYVLLCDFEGCLKVYHKSCAQLTREPEDEWYCPDHPITQPKLGKRKSSAKKNATEPPLKKKRLLKVNKLVQNGVNDTKPVSRMIGKLSRGRLTKANLAEKKKAESPTVAEAKKPVQCTTKTLPTNSISGKHDVSAGNKKTDLSCSSKNLDILKKVPTVNGDTMSTVSIIPAKQRPASTTTIQSTLANPIPTSSSSTPVIVDSCSVSHISNASTLTGNSEHVEGKPGGRQWRGGLQPDVGNLKTVTKSLVGEVESSKKCSSEHSPSERTRSQRLVAKRKFSAPVMLEPVSKQQVVNSDLEPVVQMTNDTDTAKGKDRIVEWLKLSENQEPDLIDEVNDKKDSRHQSLGLSNFLPVTDFAPLESSSSPLYNIDIPSPLSVRPDKNVLTTPARKMQFFPNGTASGPLTRRRCPETVTRPTLDQPRAESSGVGSAQRDSQNPNPVFPEYNHNTAILLDREIAGRPTVAEAKSTTRDTSGTSTVTTAPAPEELGPEVDLIDIESDQPRAESSDVSSPRRDSQNPKLVFPDDNPNTANLLDKEIAGSPTVSEDNTTIRHSNGGSTVTTAPASPASEELEPEVEVINIESDEDTSDQPRAESFSVASSRRYWQWSYLMFTEHDHTTPNLLEQELAQWLTYTFRRY